MIWGEPTSCDCPSVVLATASDRFDWADCDDQKREHLRAHLRDCAECRHRLLQIDPLWALRLSSSAADGPVEESACNVDQEIEQMQQRVWGSIRARSLETEVAESRTEDVGATGRRFASWIAAAGLLLAAGTAVLIDGSNEMTEQELAARSELRSHLDALPVVDQANWFSAPVGVSAEADGMPSGAASQVLAQLSDADADVVWVVNASLEL